MATVAGAVPHGRAGTLPRTSQLCDDEQCEKQSTEEEEEASDTRDAETETKMRH